MWVRDLNIGSDAVIVFFVLSGFVIALVAAQKKGGFGGYLFDRITRLVSVALPALVLGFAMDRVGAELAPELYVRPYYNPLPLWEQVLRGLTFSNEWSLSVSRLGSNGPYWSLSYEVAFYLLFGFAFYLRGIRRVLMLITGLLLFGLNVLLLMPAWLLGVVLYHLVEQRKLPQGTMAWALAGLPVLGYVLALTFDLPGFCENLTTPVAQVFKLRFSDEFVWNGLLGILVLAHLSGIAGLMRERSFARAEGIARWLAGGSFSLYVIHYPLLQIYKAVLPMIGGLAGDAFLLSVTFVTCMLFAAVFERPLPLWRAFARRVYQRAKMPGQTRAVS